MTDEDFIRELKESREVISAAIDKLNQTLCSLALQDNEDDETWCNLHNVAYGIERLKEVCACIDSLQDNGTMIHNIKRFQH